MAEEALQPLSDDQFTLYANRKRTLSRRSLASRLRQTHDLGISLAGVNVQVPFPIRTVPITFSTIIQSGGVDPTGVIYDFGPASNKTKLEILAGNILSVSSGGTSGLTGVSGQVTLGGLGVAGKTHEITLAVNPGAGKARLWVNGVKHLRLQQDPVTPFLNTEWAAEGSAIIASGLTDFAIVDGVRAFVGQLPRSFD